MTYTENCCGYARTRTHNVVPDCGHINIASLSVNVELPLDLSCSMWFLENNKMNVFFYNKNALFLYDNFFTVLHWCTTLFKTTFSNNILPPFYQFLWWIYSVAQNYVVGKSDKPLRHWHFLSTTGNFGKICTLFLSVKIRLPDILTTGRRGYWINGAKYSTMR